MPSAKDWSSGSKNRLTNFMVASNHPRWLVPVLCLVLVVCLTVEIFGVRALMKGYAANDWPTVVGTIVQSEIEWAYNYKVHIAYDYVVNGKKYNSNFVGAQRTTSKLRGDIAHLLDKYPIGAQIDVHYNPSDPTDACLEPGLSIGNWLIVVVPLLLVAAAGADLLRKYSQWRAVRRDLSSPSAAPTEI